MTEYCIDGAAISDQAALHTALAEMLNFPAWYGGNLDALYDCLTALRDPAHLHIINWSALAEHLGAYAVKFRCVLEDAAQETASFTFCIE